VGAGFTKAVEGRIGARGDCFQDLDRGPIRQVCVGLHSLGRKRGEAAVMRQGDDVSPPLEGKEKYKAFSIPGPVKLTPSRAHTNGRRVFKWHGVGDAPGGSGWRRGRDSNPQYRC
jgi:hypothetical protein